MGLNSNLAQRAGTAIPALRRCAAACLMAVFVVTERADATWSIVLVNTRTGEIAAACATCISDEDERDWTVTVVPGAGAANVQAGWDFLQSPLNRVQIRDGLILGREPGEILDRLALIDANHQARQYGIVDVLGRSASFTGSKTSAWTGGMTGIVATPDGPVAYAVQGNVLTGPCVVDGVIDALSMTPGDLPSRLMAAMEAARDAGGDGRCSCAPSTPTACGCPPATVVKSAHNGFMIVSRTGDLEGSPGLYRAGTAPYAVLVTDLDGDGRPDLACTNGSSGDISVLRNITPANSPAPIFDAPVNYPVAASPRGIAVGDITGDGLPDLISGGFTTTGPVSVLPGVAGGGFGARADYPVGGSVGDITVGDFDGVRGLDVACAMTSLHSVRVLLNDGAGSLVAQTPVSLGAATGPFAIAAAHIDGDPAIDLAVALRTAGQVVVLRNTGGGVFVAGAPVAVGAAPSGIASADLDGDGDVDFAVANATGQSVSVLLDDAGILSRTDVPVGATALRLAAADVTGDGTPDLVVACGLDHAVFGFPVFGRFTVLHGLGAGAFALSQVGVGHGPLNSVAMGDLDMDGDQDAAMVSFSPTVGCAVILENIGEGIFDSGIGGATGDYFMSLSSPDTTAGAVDPVTQLEGEFDRWRGEHIGRPDAVRCEVAFDPASIPASFGGTGEVAMTIRLRDWQDQPVETPLSELAIEALPGSAPVSIGTPFASGAGEYTVAIVGGSAPGTARLRVRIDDGARPVILMPDPSVTVDQCLADCDESRGLDFFDFLCFQNAFAAGCS